MSTVSSFRTVALRASSPFGDTVKSTRERTHARSRGSRGSRGSRRPPEQRLVISEKESL